MSADDFGNELDLEYTPILHAIGGKFCAADDHYATQAQLAEFVHSNWQVQADMLVRLEQLEASADKVGSDLRHLQRTAKILDKAYKLWREDDQENSFWAYVMESVGQVDAETVAEYDRKAEAARPAMDENGVWVSHDAWDAMERELAELRAKEVDAEMLQRMVVGLHKAGSESIEEIVRLSSELHALRAELAAAQAEAAKYKALWESVPWNSIEAMLHLAMQNGVPFKPYKTIDMWRIAKAPKEPTE